LLVPETLGGRVSSVNGVIITETYREHVFGVGRIVRASSAFLRILRGIEVIDQRQSFGLFYVQAPNHVNSILLGERLELFLCIPE
jgi:Ribonuclease G/E